ncbi:MAG: hypothetical protein ACLT63_06690 [Bacteroides xylanisolvens]
MLAANELWDKYSRNGLSRIQTYLKTVMALWRTQNYMMEIAHLETKCRWLEISFSPQRMQRIERSRI